MLVTQGDQWTAKGVAREFWRDFDADGWPKCAPRVFQPAVFSRPLRVKPFWSLVDQPQPLRLRHATLRGGDSRSLATLPRRARFAVVVIRRCSRTSWADGRKTSFLASVPVQTEWRRNPLPDAAADLICTAQLLLRRPETSDVEPFLEIAQDREVMKYATKSQPTVDVDVAQRTVARLMRAWDSSGFGQWTVIERATEQIIGIVGLQTVAGCWASRWFGSSGVLDGTTDLQQKPPGRRSNGRGSIRASTTLSALFRLTISLRCMWRKTSASRLSESTKIHGTAKSSTYTAFAGQVLTHLEA